MNYEQKKNEPSQRDTATEIARAVLDKSWVYHTKPAGHRDDLLEHVETIAGYITPLLAPPVAPPSPAAGDVVGKIRRVMTRPDVLIGDANADSVALANIDRILTATPAPTASAPAATPIRDYTSVVAEPTKVETASTEGMAGVSAAPVNSPTPRQAWEAGFTLAVGYGDNHVHFQGEQKERQWQRLLKEYAALPASAAPVNADAAKIGSGSCEWCGGRPHTNEDGYCEHCHQGSETHNKFLSLLQSERDTLRKTVDALPKTADGVPVVPGMKVFHLQTKNAGKTWQINERKVVSLHERYGLEFAGEPDRHLGTYGRIYSTMAAAEAGVATRESALATAAKQTPEKVPAAKVGDAEGGTK